MTQPNDPTGGNPPPPNQPAGGPPMPPPGQQPPAHPYPGSPPGTGAYAPPPGGYGPPPHTTGGPGGPSEPRDPAPRPAVATSAGSGMSKTTVSLVARIAGVLLVALGLSLPFDDTSMWSTNLAWSIFAIVAAVVALIASFGTGSGWSAGTSWMVGAVATAALVVFWILIALPGVASNSGFCLTLGVGAIVAAAYVLGPTSAGSAHPGAE